MRIGIYAGILAGKKTGIGKYVYYLCKYLDKYLKDKAKVFLFSNKPLQDIPFSSTKTFLCQEENSLLKRLPPSLWLAFFSYRLINKYNLNCFWATVPILPKGIKNLETLLTVYDLNLYEVPNTMRLRTLVLHGLFFKKSILKADKLIAISRGTAEKVKKYFNREVSVVVRPSVERDFCSSYTDEVVNNLLKRKGIPKGKYILFVSTIEPRKNVKILLDSFLDLKRSGYLKDYKLVLVGDKGWKSRKIHEKIKRAKDVVYLGYVREEEVPLLYKGASLLVMPSVYEGFGIPVLEARACGCCVIASDIPELREAGGEGCIYIKPTRESLKNALIKFFEGKISCNEKKLRESLFFWDEEAKKMADLLLREVK